MLHSSNCESSQQGSSIPLSQPRILLNPVIPTVISDIPCILSIPNLAPICFLFLNTGLQLRQIPHPEKSTEDPQNEAGNPDCYLWHPASRAYFQYQVSPSDGANPGSRKTFWRPSIISTRFQDFTMQWKPNQVIFISCILIPEYDQSNAPYSKHEKRFRNNSASIYYNRKISLPFLSDHAFSVHLKFFY